ncbi:MFS transporter [Streptomyces sp. NPDC058231]|uniref:MFS transporter n=1 Tax=Streptomyces sp. NPDC058231 TaxID=3346392 RepID=UPI0036E7EEA7
MGHSPLRVPKLNSSSPKSWRGSSSASRSSSSHGINRLKQWRVPALAALTRWWAPDHVRALTIVTLAGGLASTVFTPATAALADHLSWRATYAVLALILAAVTIRTPLASGTANRSPHRVRGRGSGRVSIAGMTCYRPGERSRLIYAVREYRGRKDEPKGFGWRDFRDLLIRQAAITAICDGIERITKQSLDAAGPRRGVDALGGQGAAASTSASWPDPARTDRGCEQPGSLPVGQGACGHKDRFPSFCACRAPGWVRLRGCRGRRLPA